MFLNKSLIGIVCIDDFYGHDFIAEINFVWKYTEYFSTYNVYEETVGFFILFKIYHHNKFWLIFKYKMVEWRGNLKLKILSCTFFKIVTLKFTPKIVI